MVKSLFHFCFFALTVCSVHLSIAQNLVPNPSFEDTVACSTNSGQFYNAAGWSSYRNTPDYYNTCADSSTLASIPYNSWGYQYPRNGNAYAAIQCYFTFQYREFFGRQLISPLIIGEKYFVSFYVNCAFGGNSLAHGGSNKTGIQFSTVPYSAASPAPINNFAHVSTDSIILDTINWIQIKGAFTADSSYDYIIVGNFFNDANTDTAQYEGGVRAVYYIDDICVSTDSTECYFGGFNSLQATEVNQNILLFPNPASGQITLINLPQNCNIEVYNISGQIINTLHSFSTSFYFDISDYSQGVYSILIKSPKAISIKHFIKNN
jgi:hypothetical protein